jgi:hypothetical protein
MQYPCKLDNIRGVSDPRMKTLCDICKSRDCENPIESKFISILGVKIKHRVYVTKNSDQIVTQCEGFVS